MIEPKLRFKADAGSQFPDWEEKKIDDVATCFAGATPSTKIPEYWEDGTIRWMSSGEVNNGQIHDTEKRISQLGFDKCSTKMVKPNTVVMALAGQGKTRGMVAITRVPLCTNQSLCAIETNDDICDDYLYQYLQTQYNNLRLISSGDGTRGGLNLKLIGGYIVSVPCFAEQQKIAEFLSTIDTVIKKQKETVSVWEERKKGVMQKLFRQEVRFKADDGSNFPEWEEKKLSEMFKKVIEKNRLDLPPLTIVQGYGTIRRDESERRIAYDEKGLKNYKAVQKDDFIVHLRSFEGGLEIANQDGIVSPAYHVYRGNDEVHPSFYYPYFRSSSFIKGKLSICVTGVRDGKNIEMGSFDELLIPHPCLAEQQKIADCLSSLDEVIENQKATLAAWEELKKGLLQQMFV